MTPSTKYHHVSVMKKLFGMLEVQRVCEKNPHLYWENSCLCKQN